MTHPIKTPGKRLLVLLTAIGAAVGSGFAATAASASPAAFNTATSNPVSGVISATLSDGAKYSGRYFQITPDTTLATIAPLWNAWDSAWAGRSGWGYWNAAPAPEFIKRYTGWIVATLGSAGGEQARCKFHLVRPAEGMAAGGTGQCQTPDGQTVDAIFSGA